MRAPARATRTATSPAPAKIPFGDGWRIGGNVPWSVGWTGEQTFTLRPSVHFPGLTDLVQAEHPGEGSPKFAQMHVTRHRLGMVSHVCHVCGRRTLNNDRYIFPVQSGGIVPFGDTQTRYVGNVPPVHLSCARRAQALCPHLVTHFADPVPYPSEESEIRPRLDVVEGLAELASTLPRGVKIVFGCIRVYGPRFSQRVGQMRRDHAVS